MGWAQGPRGPQVTGLSKWKDRHPISCAKGGRQETGLGRTNVTGHLGGRGCHRKGRRCGANAQLFPGVLLHESTKP